TIIYAGNLGYLQGLDILLKAFSQLSKNNNNYSEWTIELIGGGTEQAELKELAKTLGIENSVKFTGKIPKEKVHPKLVTADLLFFSLKSHSILEKTIPSKLFDYLITGVPIIGGIKGEGKDILHEVEANMSFEAGNVADLEKKLSHALDNIEELKKQAHQNIKLVKQNYTREKMTKKLIEKFSIITNCK